MERGGRREWEWREGEWREGEGGRKKGGGIQDLKLLSLDN